MKHLPWREKWKSPRGGQNFFKGSFEEIEGLMGDGTANGSFKLPGNGFGLFGSEERVTRDNE
jgi:hypothetical protein